MRAVKIPAIDIMITPHNEHKQAITHNKVLHDSVNHLCPRTKEILLFHS